MRAAVGDGDRIGPKRKLAVCLAGLLLAAGCGSAPAGGGGTSPAQPGPGQQPGGQSGSATAPGGQPGQGQGQHGPGPGGTSGGPVRKQVMRASGGFEVTVGGPTLGAPGFFFAEAVEFGAQQLGTPSASKVFRVKLATSYPARIDRVGAANSGVEADVAQFPVSTDECSGLTLRPQGEACTVAIRFVPETSGDHNVFLVASVTILCQDRDQFPCAAAPDPDRPPVNFPRQDVSPSGQVTVPHSEPLARLHGEGVDPSQGTTTGSETTASSESSESESSETSGSTGSTEAPPGSGTTTAPSAPTSSL
jgi:hypothetical protein